MVNDSWPTAVLYKPSSLRYRLFTPIEIFLSPVVFDARLPVPNATLLVALEPPLPIDTPLIVISSAIASVPFIDTSPFRTVVSLTNSLLLKDASSLTNNLPFNEISSAIIKL